MNLKIRHLTISSAPLGFRYPRPPKIFHVLMYIWFKHLK